MARIEETIDVDVPVSTAYNQWTQFEEFPHFMEGVEERAAARRHPPTLDGGVGGKKEEWRAEITEQHPDHRIAWKATDGRENAGVVTFHQIDETHVARRVADGLEPDGIIESAGAAVGMDSHRVKGDLKRFKEMIESRGTESDAWRGEVENDADRST